MYNGNNIKMDKYSNTSAKYYYEGIIKISI